MEDDTEVKTETVSGSFTQTQKTVISYLKENEEKAKLDWEAMRRQYDEARREYELAVSVRKAAEHANKLADLDHYT